MTPCGVYLLKKRYFMSSELNPFQRSKSERSLSSPVSPSEPVSTNIPRPFSPRISRGISLGRSLEDRAFVIPSEEVTVLENGGRYKGALKDGVPHGFGTVEVEGQGIYKGYFQDGNPTGWGTLTLFSLGESYEGFFEDGRLQEGTVYYPDGTIYKGKLQDLKPHGLGATWKLGRKVSQGDFENGQMKKGSFWYPNGDFYEGFLENRLPVGSGIFITKTGDKYKGIFKDGQVVKGAVVYSNGDVYEGDFLDGQPHGIGVLIWEDGEYRGEFQNGEIHGEGVCYLKHPSEEGLVLHYTGEFKEGAKDGIGTYYTPSGNRLFATWKNDYALLDRSFLSNPVFLRSLLNKEAFDSSMSVLCLFCAYWKEKGLYPEMVSIFEKALRVYNLPIEESPRKVLEDLTKEEPEAHLILVNTKDHAMLLEIEPKGDVLAFKIYNAGSGTTFHKVHEENPDYYQTMLQIEVPKNSVNEALLGSLMEKGRLSTRRFYRSILKLEGARRVEVDNPVWQKAQKGPNCSLKSVLVFLKQQFREEHRVKYSDFRLGLFDACIEAVQSSDDPEERQFLPALRSKREKTLSKANREFNFLDFL